MATIRLKLPKLDMSMEEATITEWFVGTGDKVSQGQAIYSVETDKATTDIECPIAGVIRVIGEVGTAYKIGEIIAEVKSQ